MQLQKANGAMDLFRRGGMHAMQSKGREEVHPAVCTAPHLISLCEIKIRTLAFASAAVMESSKSGA